MHATCGRKPRKRHHLPNEFCQPEPEDYIVALTICNAVKKTDGSRFNVSEVGRNLRRSLGWPEIPHDGDTVTRNTTPETRQDIIDVDTTSIQKIGCGNLKIDNCREGNFSEIKEERCSLEKTDDGAQHVGLAFL